jgi:hypothetical protein
VFTLPALVLACCSCTSRERKPVFPVRGKVFYQEKPTRGALVFLHPLDGSKLRGRQPRGLVGADGSFRVTTYEPNDGAPAGKYAVTIVWQNKPEAGDSEEENLLPPRYLSPATSGLQIEVREGDNELPPFQLTE